MNAMIPATVGTEKSAPRMGRKEGDAVASPSWPFASESAYGTISKKMSESNFPGFTPVHTG